MLGGALKGLAAAPIVEQYALWTPHKPLARWRAQKLSPGCTLQFTCGSAHLPCCCSTRVSCSHGERQAPKKRLSKQCEHFQYYYSIAAVYYYVCTRTHFARSPCDHDIGTIYLFDAINASNTFLLTERHAQVLHTR